MSSLCKAVLDNSALMALLDEEPGAEMVRAVIFDSVISSVTLAEAYSVLSIRGKDGIAALSELRFAMQDVVPFTEEQAETAGALRTITRSAGLSLGDRACLALGIALNVTVYTADRAWTKVNVGCSVQLIR